MWLSGDNVMARSDLGIPPAETNPPTHTINTGIIVIDKDKDNKDNDNKDNDNKDNKDNKDNNINVCF